MRSVVAAAGLAALFALPLTARAGAPIYGMWNFTPAAAAGSVDLELRYSGFCKHRDDCTHSTSVDVPLSSLGLRASDVAGAIHREAFHMLGDAGNLTFSGTVGGGLGVGRFTFAPSDAYAAAVARDGVTAPDAQEQLGALLLGVTIAYVRGIAQAGLHESDFAMFLAMRALGVDEAYARAMIAAEPSITGRDLVAFRALHVSPVYIASLARAGYPNLSVHDLIAFKAMHIDAAFVREVEQRGYAHPSPSELIRLKALHF